MGIVQTLPKEAVRADFARQLERELDEAREENLEQARLIGMSGEREADLRGELEREKLRAEENGILAHDLGIQLAEAREQRDRLAQVIEAENVMISANALRNVLLAYDGLRGALAVVKDSANTPDQPR